MKFIFVAAFAMALACGGEVEPSQPAPSGASSGSTTNAPAASLGCSDLRVCCDTMKIEEYKVGCRKVLASDDRSTCGSAVASYRKIGDCP